MKTFRFVLFLFCLSVLCANASEPQLIEQWKRFEISLQGPSKGYPVDDVSFDALFWQSGDTVRVSGFYDGGGCYRLRFMPHRVGEWHYCTLSNQKALNGHKGRFECVDPKAGNHGPVHAEGRTFRYADGTYFYPVGTTAYAWSCMPHAMRCQTLQSLRAAQFNKVRMLFFPNRGITVEQFPFAVPSTPDVQSLDLLSTIPSDGSQSYWSIFESLIDSLDAQGCQADVIIFHPYDKGEWGYDRMSLEQNLKYMRYLQARLSAYKNVWWSMSNEYDYCDHKTESDWQQLIAAAKTNDPYHHLISIHGSTACYYPYWRDGLTHASIQDEAPVAQQGRASILWSIYRDMPVVFDEVRYEGNLTRRWGRMTGEEMLYEMYNGLMQGCYVTHGECYETPEEGRIPFFARGGTLTGQSWSRIPFLQSVLADLPRPLQPADVSRDDRVSTAGNGYYLVWFGMEAPDYWTFDLPSKNGSYKALKQAGKQFKVEILDVWNQTITPVDTLFVTSEPSDYRVTDQQHRGIQLPGRPFILLRIKEVGASANGVNEKYEELN